MKWLAKEVSIEHAGSESLKNVCTGETMKDVDLMSLDIVSMTSFRSLHTVGLHNRYAHLADLEL